MLAAANVEQVRSELVLLFDYIQKMKGELAALRRMNGPKFESFDRMADQLDAITEATASATDTILSTVEEIGAKAEELRGVVPEEGKPILDRVDELIGTAFEACSFQDITGQRISKIVHSMQYIDDRVSAMAALWGDDHLREVAGDEEEIDPDQALLNGPALAGEGVSQDEIDKMFD